MDAMMCDTNKCLYRCPIYVPKMLDSTCPIVIVYPIESPSYWAHTQERRTWNMYISIKLPPAFGSFNRLRQENYPFNNLFTAYLAEVSRLGLSLGMDVEELVGYIEDRIFEGQRLPDIPEGNEPVNMRYSTDDPDVVAYIGGSELTNRMAVLYITRMTLRLSATYGNSLFRLTRLITDLGNAQGSVPVKAPKEKPAVKETVRPKPVPPVKKEPVPIKQPAKEEKPAEEVPMPRVSSKAVVREPEAQEPAMEEQKPSVLESAEAAKAALNELAELTAAVQSEEGEVIETNPLLGTFGGL